MRRWRKSHGNSDRKKMNSVLAPIDNDLALAGLNLEQVDGKSRTDRVYHQMRDRLMRGIFKPHQRLRISELSQAFGTSETPVREAIFQLIRDGAVEAKTHSYYRVRKLSVAEYTERREIRLLLQPLAARRALELITESDIDLLERMHAKLVAAEAAKDYETAVRANFDFHFGLYRLSKMPALIGMIENSVDPARPDAELSLSRRPPDLRAGTSARLHAARHARQGRRGPVRRRAR